MRYDDLLRLADKKRPKVLIEIGTHRGTRAAALKSYCRKYYGFDLWESGNENTDAIERNGKGRSTKAQAAAALHGADFELIEGDTKETLPRFVERGIFADFVFIDGGHSVETIASDFDNVRKILNPGAVVVFDDYYTPESPGFGCNRIVSSLKHKMMASDVMNGDLTISLVSYEHP